MRSIIRRRHWMFLVFALTTCTDVPVQLPTALKSTLDDRLSVRGRVCTALPDPDNFPVKIIFLVDSSGSMCVSDPPGAQASAGFCERALSTMTNNGFPLPETPGRVRALQDLMERFSAQRNVSVALIPFETSFGHVYPPSGFVAADDGQLPDAIKNLQNQLGKGTDYQGALDEAYRRIEADILGASRASLPRTKYVVILLTDGTPYPRCAGVDNLDPSQYATASNPAGIWKDNPASFCNTPEVNVKPDGSKVIADFVAGTDRNQNYQLWDPIDRLMTLRDKYNIGELHLHTILLFNTAAAQACGSICLTDLYNGMATAQDAHDVAAWTLKQMAVEHGNGTFQEFNDQASIQLGSLDYSSLYTRYVQKTFLASNRFAYPDLDGPKVDSDGDGAIDEHDNTKVLGTSNLNVDSDGDGFPDAFEIAHRADGFDPLVADARGCKPTCRDVDGDGLSQAMESYLGTDPTLPDTDADGIPDGIEAMFGLDPLVPNNRLSDRDLDGVPDILELFQHTNPLLDDRGVHARDGYSYQLTEVPQSDGRVCYDFLVSNIRLLTPDAANGQHGYNFITLTFAEAPEGGVGRDYGAWKEACVIAQFAPPSLRKPQGPEITVPPEAFRSLASIRRVPGSLLPAEDANNPICVRPP